MLPAIAMSLLVVGAAIALVLNSLWKDTVTVELRNAAEAAALAAAGEFLGDQLLIPETDRELLADQARHRAAEVAAVNRVAGQPVVLNLSAEEGDVFFGRQLLSELSDAEGHFTSTIIQSETDPEFVEVRARRTREAGNPIRFFFAGVTGQPWADAQAIAVAEFDNHIDHFQPTAALPVPALPLAILANDPAGQRSDTWAVNIEQRLGRDDYRFDEQTRTVVAEPDGIPEIELTSIPVNTSGLAANVQLLDWNNQFRDQELVRQIQLGLTADDLADNLASHNGRIPADREFLITGSGSVAVVQQQALAALVGQQRLCLLYHQAEASSVAGWSNLVCRGVVAIRILKVIPQTSETVTLVVQPTVMTTKTAVLSRFLEADLSGNPESPQGTLPNPYVYKLFLRR